MSSRNYDALAERLAGYARLHPRMYRARVAALAVLGYAYLFAAIVLLAALIAGAVWMILNNVGAYAAIKLGIPAVVLSWMVGKSLWVRFPPPEGIALRPGEAPALLAEIEHVRRAMKAPRVHTVLITDEFNAAVYQYPRLGVFGWYRTYLLLGLPYMAGMPADEFRAVLAHEFGHVSRRHGRFGAWIARVHTTWLRLMEELDRKNHWAQGMFTRFFDWYAPYFTAYTSVLRRANEFEADRMAEEVSPGASAPSLCRGQVTAQYLGREFWAGIWARTTESVEPPTGVHVRLLEAVRTAHEHASAQAWLDEALRETTGVADTHPALRERLGALGQEPVIPGPFDISAAEALLGGRVRPLADRMTHEWRAAAGPHWREQHRRAQEILGRLAELEGRGEAITPQERGERVWLTAELHGDRVAVPMARALLDEQQEDASLHFLLGRALAGDDDPGALPHLEVAMSADREYVIPACMMAHALLRRLGRDDEAAAYWARAQDHQRVVDAAYRERGLDALKHTDAFLPHGLDDARLAEVSAQLAVPGVKRAYLVRKRVVHLPEEPCFVIAVVPGWRTGLPGSGSQRLVERVIQGVTLPGTCIVITLESMQRRFSRPIREVPGSEVYRAPSLFSPAVPLARA